MMIRATTLDINVKTAPLSGTKIYGRLKCGMRVLMDATSDISDTAETRLISLAHAFVFEYFEDVSPDRSLRG